MNTKVTADSLTAQFRQLIEREEERLREVLQCIDTQERDRRQEIGKHDAMIRDLERQRYESVNPREKDKLTAEIRRLDAYDPGKYKLTHNFRSQPYFGSLTIADADPRIGTKTYLIGKQGLLAGTSALVIDWRKAEMSQLFYDYEEGEEYDEEIVGRDRNGIIAEKLKYGINRAVLGRISTATANLELIDGDWTVNGSSLTTQQIKESKGDFRMTDIVALISAEQFRLITKSHLGCTYLTGGAGSGKTTVALHRLSYLIYAQPQNFRPQRCLVVMFNRALQGYVRATSQDLIHAATPVKTFHQWVEEALPQCGVSAVTRAQREHFTELKKSSAMKRVLEDYAAKAPQIADPYSDLMALYTNQALFERHFGATQKIAQFCQHYLVHRQQQERSIDFSDQGILLRLMQLRSGEDGIPAALNWYDHMIIDEAQDLSRVELDTLAAACSKRKSMTICADVQQRILDFLDDSGFPSFQADLNKTGMDSAELSISYRSTAQIMQLAARVSGRPAGQVVKNGPEPRHHHFADKQQATTALYRAIRALSVKEPHSLTAIICRYKKEAEELYTCLKPILGVRLETQTFNFKPGIIITNAHQVKGLEFSGVILWNPSRHNYPETEISRNLLYVAITRASERLATYSYNEISGLLAE